MAGWFDEQIQQRKINDKTQFEGSFAHMASAVMGRGVYTAYADNSMLARNAIEAVLKSFHLKAGKVPDRVLDPEEQMEYMLRPHGIMHRRVKLTSGWYKDAFGPMIAVRKDDGTFVALLQGNGSDYTFFDTHEGIQRRVDARSEGIFEEEALCFYRPMPLKSMSMKDMMQYIMKTVSFRDQAMLIIATALVTLVGTLMPRFQNILLSKVLTDGTVLKNAE